MYLRKFSLIKSLNMKKLFATAIFCLAGFIASAQFIYKIKADSLLVTNDSCNAELNLENSTRNVKGFLYNKGNGRTEFRRGAIKLNDSLYMIGADTINLAGGGSFSAWKLTGNAGTNPSFNFLGTTDTNPLIFKTDNTEKARITTTGAFQLGNSVKFVPEASNIARVTTINTGDTSADLRLRVLRFADNNQPWVPASGTIYASQGNFLTITAPSQVNFLTPMIATSQPTTWAMGAAAPLVMTGGGNGNNPDFIDLYSYDPTNIGNNVGMSFSLNKQSGTKATIARIDAAITDTITASPDGQLEFSTMTNSTLAKRLIIDSVNFMSGLDSVFAYAPGTKRLVKTKINNGSAQTLQQVTDVDSVTSHDIKIRGVTIGNGKGVDSSNVVFGYQALENNTQALGALNVAIGHFALRDHTSGFNNTAVGGYSLWKETTGSSNTAIGAGAMATGSSTTGSSNTAVGVDALNGITSGAANTVLGSASGQGITTGGSNVIIGYRTGNNLAGFSNPSLGVYIGYQATGLSSSETNAIVIGQNSPGLGTNTTVIGNSSTTVAKIYGSNILDGNADTLATKAYARSVGGGGGGSTPTLQQVTNVGNTTTNNIVVTDGTSNNNISPTQYFINAGKQFLASADQLYLQNAAGTQVLKMYNNSWEYQYNSGSWNSTNLVFINPTANNTIKIPQGSGTDTLATKAYARSVGGGGGGSGTVTSVDMSVPSWLSVSGNPITTSGTLAVTTATGQTANQFLATPNGSTGAVGLRSIVAADIPNLDAAKITTGTMATARLGSGTADNTTYLGGDQAYHSALMSKGITMVSPTSSENVMLFYTDVAITITKVAESTRGTSPSTTYNIKYASDRSTTGTSVFSSNRAITSTTGTTTTTFASASIPAGSYVWLITSATSGTVNDFNVTIIYRQ
jgi:hypothetical protein